MLVVDLGKWMNKILIDWGIDPKVADRFDDDNSVRGLSSLLFHSFPLVRLLR